MPIVREVKKRIKEKLALLETQLSETGRLDIVEVDQLRALDALLDAAHREALFRLRPWLLGLLVGVLLACGTLLSCHESITTFSATITAPTVHMRVHGTIPLENIGSNQPLIAGWVVDSLFLPKDMTSPRTIRRDEGFRLGQRLILQTLDVPNFADLSFSYRSDSSLQMHLECPSRTECRGTQLIGIVQDISTRLPKNPVDSRVRSSPIRFSLSENSADLSLGRITSYTLLSNLDVAELTFLDAREAPLASKGTEMLWSGVQAGDIHLPDLQQTVSLVPGDWINVSGARLRVARLFIQDSTLVLMARGKASTLDLVNAGATRTLKPTIMELLVAKYQWRAQLIWGALALSLWFFLRLVGSFWGKTP